MSFLYGEWKCEHCKEAIADLVIRHKSGQQTFLCEPCWREYVHAKLEEPSKD